MSNSVLPFIIVRNARRVQTNAEDQTIYIRSQAPKKIWNTTETLQYIRFFEENPQLIESSQARKRLKLFYRLAQSIQTRTPAQIKSHHQKLLKAYGSITRVIQGLKIKFLVDSNKTDIMSEIRDYYLNQGEIENEASEYGWENLFSNDHLCLNSSTIWDKLIGQNSFLVNEAP